MNLQPRQQMGLGSRQAASSALTLALLTSAATGAAVIGFDDDSPGASPRGWTCGKTGKGEPRWTVEQDEAAPSKPNLLKQSGEATYPVCLRTNSDLKDGYVEVKFKPVAGSEDQAGGVVWRAKDSDNYYIARANALEDNVVAYKTVNGKRQSLSVKGRMFGYGVDVKVPKGRWCTLRVEFKGNVAIIIFNGRKLFEVQDTTLPNAGQVGVWTKADSVTLFDDFSFGAS